MKKITLLVLFVVAALATAQASVAKSPKPTPPHAPQVSTGPATAVGQTAATLTGSVNPRGNPTTYHFDYGATTAYGHSTAAASAGSGTTAKSVSARVTGLAPGTTYHFRLVASNSAGTTTGKGSHFTTAPRLTIGAKPSPVIFGSATKISGQLQSQGNAGRTVELQATPFPYKGFVKVATTTTDALGRYSFTQSPTVNTHYQVVAKGPTVTSRTLKLGVRIRLTRKASDTTPAIGQKVRFTGFACPAHIGDVVSLQRRRNGHWETVKQTHLVKAASSATCSNRSRYSVGMHIKHTRTFRTVAAGDFDHVTGISPTLQITVH